MNVYKIAMFVFLIQQAIWLVSLADIPIACTSDGSACIYFESDTITGTTWAAVIAGEVESGQYKSTQIETEIDADVWTATAMSLNIATTILYAAWAGAFSLVTFFFGWTTISVAFAALLQTLVYYFYLILVAKIIKDVGGDI